MLLASSTERRVGIADRCVDHDPVKPDSGIAALSVFGLEGRKGCGAYHLRMGFQRITIDPAKMRGAPCVRGLRIPVATVIGQLAAGRSTDEILADFPDLEAADITAALEYAAEAVQERELPLTRPA